MTVSAERHAPPGPGQQPAGRPRVLLPGLLPADPRLERYRVHPGAVTAVELDAGDEITIIDAEGRQRGELTVLARAVGGRAHLGEPLAAAGEDGQLAPLPSLGVDDGDLVARVEFHRGDRAGVHPVPLQPRVGRRQAGKQEAGPVSGHLPRVGRGLALR